MTDQLELDFEPPAEALPDATIAERFAAYHEAHPEVFALFLRFARELRAAGRDRYSADAILHRCRWHYAIEGRDASGFKLNNNYASRYARKLMSEYPDEFSNFFELRELKAP
jgi:hypothetical protein